MYLKSMETIQKYALLYCRISLVLDEELLLKGETKSTEHQYAIMEEYCTKNNLVILDKFIDFSISGRTITDRPALQDLLSKLGENMVVICENVARLSRETNDLMYIYKLIKNAGSELVILDMSFDPNSLQLLTYNRIMKAFHKVYDPDFNGPIKMPTSLDTPEGQCFLEILGEFATLTRKENGQKISNCMTQALKQGKLRTKPKFGYQLVNRVYVEKPEEQKIITYIKSLLKYNPNLAACTIAMDLKEKGFLNRNGKPIHTSTVQSIINEINNPTMPRKIQKQLEEPVEEKQATIKTKPYVYCLN